MVFPTSSSRHASEMSLREFETFLARTDKPCGLHPPDPLTA